MTTRRKERRELTEDELNLVSGGKEKPRLNTWNTS